MSHGVVHIIQAYDSGGGGGYSYMKPIDFMGFFIWLDKTRKLETLKILPIFELRELIEEYAQQTKQEHSFLSISDIQDQILSPTENFEKILKEKILQRKPSILIKKRIKDLVKRYKKVKFHGIFLFPKSNQEKLFNFFDIYKDDLNSLTGDEIIIYFNEKEVRNVSGYEILKNVKKFNDLNVELPCFLLWDNNLKENNYTAFPLRGVKKKEIYRLVEKIVIGIRDGKSIKEISNTDIQVEIKKKTSKKVTPENVKTKVVELVKKNNTIEALNLLNDYPKFDDEKKKTVILLNSSYSKLQESMYNGLVSSSNIKVEMMRINSIILDLIN